MKFSVLSTTTRNVYYHIANPFPDEIPDMAINVSHVIQYETDEGKPLIGRVKSLFQLGTDITPIQLDLAVETAIQIDSEHTYNDSQDYAELNPYCIAISLGQIRFMIHNLTGTFGFGSLDLDPFEEESILLN